MGATRGSAQSHLVIDAPWAHEEAGEDAVLAQFADEATLGATGLVHTARPDLVVSAVGPRALVDRPAEPQRAWWNRRRLADAARTAIVACLTAMALGASFAIGFGYVWSDRTPPMPAAGQRDPAPDPARMPRPLWWLPLPPAAASAAKPPEPGAATEATSRRAGTSQARQRPSAGGPAQVSARTPARPVEARPVTAPPVAPARSPGAGSALSSPVAGNTVAASTRDVAVAPPAAVLDSRGIGAPFTESSPIGETSRTVPVPSVSTAMIGVSPKTGSVARTAANRPDIDAVRHTIALYQSAYSQMDVGAMAAVWPSLDTAGVERAFAGVERQALTLTECRVTTAGSLATAVCPGQVRYVGRVGGRQMQERQGIWTIALERRADSWQVVRLNVRESAPSARSVRSPQQ